MRALAASVAAMITVLSIVTVTVLSVLWHVRMWRHVIAGPALVPPLSIPDILMALLQVIIMRRLLKTARVATATSEK